MYAFVDAGNDAGHFRHICHMLLDADTMGDPQVVDSLAVQNASATQLQQLGRALSPTTELSKINLWGGGFCQAGTDPSVVRELCDFLEENNHIDHFGLDFGVDMTRRLSTGGGRQVIVPMGPHPQLDYVVSSLLIQAFSRNTHCEKKRLELARLDLSKLSGVLSEALIHGFHTLRVERMPEIDINTANSLQACLEGAVGLHTLVIGSQISPSLLSALESGLTGNPTLREVCLAEMTFSLAKPLCGLLGSCPNLVRLSLSRLHRMPVAPFAEFAESIHATSVLKVVDLSDCSLSRRHACALGDLIRRAPPLRVLKLCKNKLGKKGLNILCRELHENETLEELYLDENMIEGDALSGVLATLFATNKGIKKLSLAGNDLSTCDQSAWDALAGNETLEDLELSNCFGEVHSWHDILRVFFQREVDMSVVWNDTATDTGRKVALALNFSRKGRKDILIHLAGPLTIDEQWGLLSDIMATIRPLRSFNMGGQSFRDEQLENLMTFLLDCPTLHTLGLHREVRQYGTMVETLCCALPNAKYIKRLEFFWDEQEPNPELFERLLGALAANRSLHWILMTNATGAFDASRTEFFALRNRVLSLDGSPASLMPRVMDHPGTRAQHYLGIPMMREFSMSSRQRRLNVAFVAMMQHTGDVEPDTKRKRKHLAS
jgi:hypothetical protein